MKLLLLYLFLLLIVLVVFRYRHHKSLFPFLPLKYDFGKRRDSFKLTMTLLKQRKAKVLIETGTSREGLTGTRSNGSATLVFGKWAKEHHAQLHSIDISQRSIDRAGKAARLLNLDANINFHLSDSIQFLKNFDQKVDFIYLDSYDYSDDIDVQIASQRHHLAEFMAIESKLQQDSLVLIDDCDLPNGGKGKMVLEYMLSKNWQIKWKGYQVLLSQG